MDDNRTKKEVVYDEEIAPVMNEVIKLCLKHGISAICSFDISGPEQPDLLATTQLPNEHGRFEGNLDTVFGFHRGTPELMDRPNPGIATSKKLTPEDI